MKPILEIQHISKRFRLQHERQPYLSLRDSLASIFRPGTATSELFYALKDIHFDVHTGESIGIIGKNGAGKSTLLKVLSKITPPSSGKIISRGRIASLLEVGTGFHPELSGRENIFLNGSILGMKRKEIASRFDEIVEFSGVHRFLDTPLKHYSSGMQLRLAFSVAAFLEPEILVIDEVLAVGDAEFQKKCLGKMEDVSKSGRTILFVSHNMSAVSNLCPRSVLLKNGRVASVGKTSDILNLYASGEHPEDHFNGRKKLNGKILKELSLSCDGIPGNFLYTGCDMTLKVRFESPAELEFPVMGIVIRDEYNQPLIGINNKHYSGNIAANKKNGVLCMQIPYLTLYAGRYSADIHWGNNHSDLEVLRDAFSFTVEKAGIKGVQAMPDEQLNRFFIKEVNWRTENDID